MGMPHATDEVWTLEQVQALPSDGNRYELVWGELLVSPSPRALHQLVLERVFELVTGYCRRERCGKAWFAPADISWGSDTLVQPDLFVVPLDEAATLDWKRMRTLTLVAEVLSPKTEKHDRFQKRRLYQSQGVGVVWLIDADKRFVEVWNPDTTFPTRETECVTWHPEGAAVPLVIELSELFA